jgi:uncharacterized membrane protein YphA (DoxX/SURF4 family)
VSKLLDRWNSWLYAPSSGQRIALVRILLSAYLLCYFGTFAGHVELSFSNLGVYTPYGAPDYAPGPVGAWAIYLLTMLACVLLLIGYRTRIIAPLLLVLFGYAYFLQLGVKESSFDRLIAIDLLVLSCADSGRAFGLDAGRPGRTPVVWPERMLQLQTVLTYFGPGLWKLLVPAWHDGVLLYSNLHGMWATPLAFRIVRSGFSLETWAAFSRCIIAFELLLGVLFVVRKTRPYALVLGTLFHVLNCVVLVVPEFLISLAAYPVFVAPATLQRLTARARAAFIARSPAPPPP